MNTITSSSTMNNNNDNLNQHKDGHKTRYHDIDCATLTATNVTSGFINIIIIILIIIHLSQSRRHCERSC